MITITPVSPAELENVYQIQSDNPPTTSAIHISADMKIPEIIELINLALKVVQTTFEADEKL